MNKEEFLALPPKKAVQLCYDQYKAGKIDRAKFDDALRAWWRNRHDQSEQSLEDVVNMVEEMFDGK